jgi:orotate phosphoribosyltransferase
MPGKNSVLKSKKMADQDLYILRVGVAGISLFYMTNETAVAEKLLQVSAVKLQPENPFTWASGWHSPIYCDNRKVLSHPYARDFIKSELCSLIFERFPDVDVLAGVATAGIPWGALAADQLKYPFIYVRPKPKEHGLGNQIEGEIREGQRVLVVEDLISTGKSSLQVCSVLKDQGLIVKGLVSIFNYGFPQAVSAFSLAEIPFYSLTNYEILVELAVKKGLVSENQLNTLLNWRNNPAEWNG